MQIYNVGLDELSEYELNQIDQNVYDWLVYWYEDNHYDGSGQAVAFRKDGLLQVKNLGHCSCFSPMDYWSNSDTVSVDEFFREVESIHDEDYSRLQPKVSELLGRL